MNSSCRLLHGHTRQLFEWNYFPLLTGRIVLSNTRKKKFEKIFSSFYLKYLKKGSASITINFFQQLFLFCRLSDLKTMVYMIYCPNNWLNKTCVWWNLKMSKSQISRQFFFVLLIFLSIPITNQWQICSRSYFKTKYNTNYLINLCM